MNIEAIATEAFENELEELITSMNRSAIELVKLLQPLIEKFIEAWEQIKEFLFQFYKEVVHPALQQFHQSMVLVKREKLHLYLRVDRCLPHWLSMKISTILPEWFMDLILREN